MQGPQLEDQLSRVDQLSSVHLHSQHRQSRSSGDPVIGETVRGYEARKLTSSREILLWMTPSEAPKALQASECNELLDPMRASCWIFAQHYPNDYCFEPKRLIKHQRRAGELDEFPERRAGELDELSIST